MLYNARSRLGSPLQHFLDKVNPAAWAIQFVTEQNISWAGSRAKAAMYAPSDDRLRLRDIGVFTLFVSELCLHLIAGGRG